MRIFLLATALIFLNGIAGAATPLTYTGENTVYEDTVWEGEVLIDGILTVAPGVTLEIRPGTVIRFTFFDSNEDGIGEHEIFVQGIFLARGTAERPVVFTSAGSDPRPGFWGALNMMASEENNRLEHCIVEYAYRGFHAHFARAELKNCLFRFNVRGAQFQESTVAIEQCRIERNLNGLQFRNSEVTLERLTVTDNHWGVRCVYSDVAMNNCRIEGNLINGMSLRDSNLQARANRISGNRKGLYLQRSKGTIEGNLLADNSEHGIFLEESECELAANRITGNGRAGLRLIDSSGRIEGNWLAGNGEYAVINDGTEDAALGSNWWGALAEEEISTLIRDGQDRQGLGLVDFSAPLAHPPAMTTDVLNVKE